NLRAEKGQCYLNKADVYDASKGMKFVVVPPDRLTPIFELDELYRKHVAEYREAFGEDLFLGATRTYLGNDAKMFFRLHQLCKQLDMPMVALGDVYYHEARRRELQDVLT